jgi:hypothetical protein
MRHRHVEPNESGAGRVGRLLTACVVARADPDLMAGGDELTGGLKTEPSVRSGDECRSHLQTIRRVTRKVLDLLSASGP